MNLDPASIAAASQLVTQGSPVVLEAAGRMFGLGAQEQQQLVDGKFPWWALLGVGLIAGWAIGTQAQKRHWAPGWLSTEE